MELKLKFRFWQFVVDIIWSRAEIVLVISHLPIVIDFLGNAPTTKTRLLLINFGLGCLFTAFLFLNSAILQLFRSHLIDPQFSHNDVVHCGGHFLPCVVMVAFFKDCMNCACTGRGNADGKWTSIINKTTVCYSWLLTDNLQLSWGVTAEFLRLCSLVDECSDIALFAAFVLSTKT